MNINLPSFENNNFEEEQQLLKNRIILLKQELTEIQQKTTAFEIILRSHLENEIIEEQELSVLYKKLQKAKKSKRLAQKKKGKNFLNTPGIVPLKKEKESTKFVEEQKEKKRLYREAMLLSHPDLYQTNNDSIEQATEITSKLIEIYQSGSLEKLQQIHAHICSGNAFLKLNKPEVKAGLKINDVYLKKELEELEIQLGMAKKRQTFIVLMTYKEPLTFIVELKEFYADRIFKLKKRTRNIHKFDI